MPARIVDDLSKYANRTDEKHRATDDQKGIEMGDDRQAHRTLEHGQPGQVTEGAGEVHAERLDPVHDFPAPTFRS